MPQQINVGAQAADKGGMTFGELIAGVVGGFGPALWLFKRRMDREDWDG